MNHFNVSNSTINVTDAYHTVVSFHHVYRGFGAQAVWSTVGVTSVTLMAGLMANISVLVVFLRTPTLRDTHVPFNVYLMNLLCANLAALLFEYPVNIVRISVVGWERRLGPVSCFLCHYVNWVLEVSRQGDKLGNKNHLYPDSDGETKSTN